MNYSNDKSPFLLSVNVITYNHEKYIAEALDSILNQKTNFRFNIVICDDFSTDNTRNILINYKRKYPEQIRLRLREKNLGLRFNYFDNIEACTGKYVAICEGDDYWTDNYKLQKQVDVLESNPEFSMCFHNALELHQYTNQEDRSNVFSNLEERTYLGNEILTNWLIPTASVVFRNNISLKFTYIDSFLFYDIILFLKLCESGKIYCINQVMSIYRRHSNSITNSNLSYESYIRHLLYLNTEFKKKYNKLIKELVAIEYLKQARYQFKKKSLVSLRYAATSVFYDATPLYSTLLSKFRV